jgi:RHS repeat-associated protein
MKLARYRFKSRHGGKRRCAGRRTAKTYTLSYDAMGRRIQSSITKQGQPSATVQYLDEGQQARGEIRDGRLSNRLLAGLGLDETITRIAITASGAKDPAASRIFLTDALNSVIAQMSDADEPTLQTSYGYSPYGQSTTVGTDSTSNPIQYTSRENDGTGLFYYRARYYDPVLKRFVSEDPIGLAGGMNMYSYVGGNPISWVDPTGLAASKWGFPIHQQVGLYVFGSELMTCPQSVGGVQK